MKKEKILKHAVLCFLAEGNKIILAMKADKIGAGFWNGYGGGINQGESPKDAAMRELNEESGGVIALPEDLEKIAIVNFHNTKSDGKKFTCRCHVYLTNKWSGEVKETSEMKTPTWFQISTLPFDEMMPTDRDWLPHALNGKLVLADAYLGPFQKEKLKETKIEFLDFFAED